MVTNYFRTFFPILIFFNVFIVFCQPCDINAQWLDFLPLRTIEAKGVRTLQVRGIIDRSHWHNRPLARLPLANKLWQNGLESHGSPYEWYLTNRLRGELTFEHEFQKNGSKPIVILDLSPLGDLNPPVASNDFRSRLFAQIWGTVGKHWAMRSSFVVDTDGILEPQYHNRTEWNGLSGDFQRAFISYASGGLSFWGGRNEISWGPGFESSLILSDNAPSLDAVGLRLKYGIFEFSSFHAFLQNENSHEDSLNINRYMAGHRVDIKLHRNLILGVSEVVRYGGPETSITAAYINPFISYYVIDVLNFQDRNDNILVAADLSYFWRERAVLFGQFLIDEYIKDDEDYPNATALLLGFDLLYPFGLDGLIINAEFARLDRWVYYYPPGQFWNRYTYLNQPLGHFLGPDAYAFSFDVSWYAGSNITLDVSTLFSRKGEGDPSTTIRPTRANGNFLSGTVENTFNGELGVTYSPRPEQFIRLSFGYQTARNEDHVAGNSSSGFEIRAQFGYRLRLRY